MTEHPILFSTPMVQAILEGRKTQTRRIVKPQPDDSGLWDHDSHPMATTSDLTNWWGETDEGEGREFKCPYGKIGDALWVRETCCAHEQPNGFDGVLYKADVAFVEIENTKEAVDKWMKLRYYGKKQYRDVPSIHMPKWASRIRLEITDIRVERLQDISEKDAIAEGVQPNCNNATECPSVECKEKGCQAAGEYFHYMRSEDDFPAFSAKESYESLWQKINGSKSWDANPWVWVIEFKKIAK